MNKHISNTAILEAKYDAAMEHAIGLSRYFMIEDINSKPIYFYSSPELVKKYPEFIKTEDFLLISVDAYQKFSLENAEIYNFKEEKVIENLKVVRKTAKTDYPYTIEPLVEGFLKQADNMTTDKLIDTLRGIGHEKTADFIYQYKYENPSDKPTSLPGITNYEKKVINGVYEGEIKDFKNSLSSIMRGNDTQAIKDFSCDIMIEKNLDRNEIL